MLYKKTDRKMCVNYTQAWTAAVE